MNSLPTTDDDICGIVLCGDFNSLLFFSSIHEIESDLFLEAWQQASGNSLGTTFPSNALLSIKYCPCSARLF